MSRYNTFSDWIDDVIDYFNISAGDMESTTAEYSLNSNGNLIAYWDRLGKFGYIDKQ